MRAAKNGACGWPTDWSAAACVTLSNSIHLDATAQGPFAVKLDWNNVPDDNRGFEIEKKLANGNFTNIATVGNVLTYNDKVGIEPLKQYTYRVRKAGNVDDFISGINIMTWTPEVGNNYRQKEVSVTLSGNVLDSAYTAIQDTSLAGGLIKNSWTNLQWLNCPVLITSGGSTLSGTVAGNTNSVFFITPALTAPVTTSDTYRILNTVSGTATAGTTTQLSDSFKNWKTSQWATTPHYLKIVSSVNSANMGQVRKIASNATTSLTIDTTAPATSFPAAIVAGDTYQVGSDFGTATPGTTTTLLIDSTKSWSTDWTAGYYLVMTSGNNNGQVRQISGYTATTLTVTPAFDNTIATNDTYLIAATGVNGTISSALAAGSSKGTAKLSASGGLVEFSSVSPGVGQNYNYEMMTLNDLTPLIGDFDMQTDYTIPAVPGLIPSDSTSNNTNLYACLRYQFTLASYGYQYQPVMCRGRMPVTYNGMATSGTTTSLNDTRVMAGTSTPWKSWETNQWAGKYLQMTNGANSLLVRKIAGNTANSITLDSAFPTAVATNDKYRINVIGGTAAGSGNSNTLLVDGATGLANSPFKDWVDNQWTGFQLKMTSGPNIGQVRTITGNTATTVTVSPPFDNQIGNYASGGDSYQIFDVGETAKAKDYYFLGINEAQNNVVEQQYFLTSDTSGRFRIAKSGNSIKFYTSSSGGEWNLMRQLDLPGSATPTLLGLYQLGSLSEPAGTSMKAQFDNFQLTPLSSHGVLGAGNTNPYSNEAQAVTTNDGNKYESGTNTILLNTTPAFLPGDGDCTCTTVGGTTVCTPGRVP
ncbi:MAG: hypothetical protein A2X79_00145 [Desulfuromonadaceae bacterium GWB2_53_15]|nr:MAG: hypothetical protein A2X79_00145 [Desulfuromonadaceae bacterium GWB2_53_15]